MGKQRRRDRGSPKGKISGWEWWYVAAKRRLYWVGTALLCGAGEAAQYVKDNWMSVQGSLPWYIAALVLGGIGVVLMMRDAHKIKNTDTREETPQKPNEVQK